MPTATKATPTTDRVLDPENPRSRLQSEVTPERPGEGHLRYITRLLSDHEEWDVGDVRKPRGHKSAWLRWTKRRWFTGTRLAPEGVMMPGNELFKKDEETNEPIFHDFRPILTRIEQDELEAYLNNGRRITQEEKRAQRDKNELARQELRTYGHQVQSASAEETLANVLAQMQGQPRAVKRAVIDAYLDAQDKLAPKDGE